MKIAIVCLIQLLLLLCCLYNTWLLVEVEAATKDLVKGFSATPDSSVSSFQSLLDDPTGSFSLGFFRVEHSQLALAVLHVPSSEPVWLANPFRSARWSKPTQLLFNGSLVLLDPRTGVLWSTGANGDRVVLLSNSNLQVRDGSGAVLWQSFDFPSDTLVENQNFTASMKLTSSNGLYSMKLGDDHIGFYMNIDGGSNQIYWERKALEAKAEIVPGNGTIYARVSSDGFLGMYQTEKAPADVQKFDSFQIQVSGIRRLRMETDGNLRAHYWNGSIWVLDYQEITKECELPKSCGTYGLCIPGKGCECLDNQTAYSSGGCLPPGSGDFCNAKTEKRPAYWVLRRNGVELPYKEVMGYEKMTTMEECESSCERNCSCWGAVFNNDTGYCYKLDYPINTLEAVGDENRRGYFKVRTVEGKPKDVGYAIGIVLLVGASLIFVGIAGFGGYKILRRRRVKGRLGEEGISPGPYRDLGSASFRSIEMCK